MRLLMMIICVFGFGSIALAQCENGVCQLPSVTMNVQSPLRSVSTTWTSGYFLPTSRTVRIDSYQRSWGRVGRSNGSTGGYGVYYSYPSLPGHISYSRQTTYGSSGTSYIVSW